MGCNISTLNLEANGVLASYPYVPNNSFYLEEGFTIAFWCPSGQELIHNHQPVTNGVFVQGCVNPNNEDITIPPPPLECAPSSNSAPPSPTGSGVRTAAPGQDSESSTGTSTTVIVNPQEPTSFVDCPIPHVPGILGYQGSFDIDQVEIVRFPVSTENDGASVYHMTPHDTITFACEDPSQELKIGGTSVEPHDINFYTYTCLVEESEEGQGFSLPLSCEDTQTGRKLRGNTALLN